MCIYIYTHLNMHIFLMYVYIYIYLFMCISIISGNRSARCRDDYGSNMPQFWDPKNCSESGQSETVCTALLGVSRAECRRIEGRNLAKDACSARAQTRGADGSLGLSKNYRDACMPVFIGERRDQHYCNMILLFFWSTPGAE